MEEHSMLTDIEINDVMKIKTLGKRHGLKVRDTTVYKIILVGGSNRGQTSFIQRLTTGEYSRTTPTIGVDFALKQLDWRDGRKVVLQFWDIAGQERTETMSRMYYQDAHACVIMFDMTYDKSLETCLKWKKDVDQKCTLDDGSPLPCILLANKSDLVKDRKFSPEEIVKFANDNGFVISMETSVKNNKNVTESMEYLVNYLLEKEKNPTKVEAKRDTVKVDSSNPISNTCCS